MKYFLMSDLHGIEPSKVMIELMDKGFKNEDPNHKIVVAGDITDGIGYDHKLIKLLQSYEKQGQLIAVKGNHDYGTKGVPYQHLNGAAVAGEEITISDIEWLRNLPYQLETKDFRLAHGIYVPDGLDLISKETVSTWGCPVLLNTNPGNWWWIDFADVTIMKEKLGSLEDYATLINDKPLFLGHFGVDTLEMYHKDLNIDEDGFASYKNIHWLDSSVIHNREIKIKVLDVR